MGQVPQYLIIGNGRAAQHFGYYLGLNNIRHDQWYRQQTTALEDKVAKSTHILLLIKDDDIVEFYNSNPCLHGKVCVHFSGSLQSEKIHGLHPLYTFGPQLYEPEVYKTIPFIFETGRATFNEIFPQLDNPSAALDPHKKALYHSYCVMSGNFTTILWQRIFKSFQKDLNLPSHLLLPYMTQVFSNLMSHSNTALTGPLARNDKKTILLHLDALMSTPYQNLYYSFISFYQNTKNTTKSTVKSFFSGVKS